MSKQLKFFVPPECDNMLAKTFLKNHCTLSSRMITRLVREKDGILMNGKLLRTIDNVTAKAEIVVNLPTDTQSQITPIKGELDIRYEDDYLLIVNKPPFMPVHPVKQHREDTLANIVCYYMSEKGEMPMFRAINRLDRDTSGLVLIAKDRYTANKIKNSVEKTYYAVCNGKIKQNGTVDAPIGLLPCSKMVRFVIPNGSPAITHYKVIYSSEELSYIELKLETGRTHQIRCHMTSIGHPLLGDDLYGGSLEKINRQALHCGKMFFNHPINNKTIKVIAPLPDDMQNIINKTKHRD